MELRAVLARDELEEPVPVAQLARAVAVPDEDPPGGAAGEALLEPFLVLADAADDLVVGLAQPVLEAVGAGAPRELATRRKGELLELKTKKREPTKGGRVMAMTKTKPFSS